MKYEEFEEDKASSRKEEGVYCEKLGDECDRPVWEEYAKDLSFL